MLDRHAQISALDRRLRDHTVLLPPATEVLALLCADGMSFTVPRSDKNRWRSAMDGPADVITWAVEPYLDDTLWRRLPANARICQGGFTVRSEADDRLQSTPDLYNSRSLERAIAQLPDRMRSVYAPITSWWRSRIRQIAAQRTLEHVEQELIRQNDLRLEGLTSRLRALAPRSVTHAELLACPPWYLTPASGYTGPPMARLDGTLYVLPEELGADAHCLLAIEDAFSHGSSDPRTVQLW